MRAGNVPGRPDGCLVDRVPERDRLRDLRHGRGEVQVGGRIEDRITTEDDEGLDRARLHRRDERGERADARKRRILRLVVADRLARVAEIRVQRANGGVDRRRLPFPGHDQSLASVRQKILGDGVDPARVDTRGDGCRRSRRGRSPSTLLGTGPSTLLGTGPSTLLGTGPSTLLGTGPSTLLGTGPSTLLGTGPSLLIGAGQACSQGREKGRYLPALETEPVIGHGSGERVDPFNRVETVHPRTRGHASSGREAPRVTDHLGVGEKRVGVEGEDDGRPIEPKHEVEVAARGRPQAGEPVLVADRVVGRPLQPRVAGTEFGREACQCGGTEGLGKDRKTGAPVGGMSLGQLPPGRHEIAPGPSLPLQRDRLRAVGIVEAEHGRLDEGARGPEGRRVLGVSLDLRRSPFVALDDQAVGAPAERHGRRVMQRDARNDLLGSVDVGNDFFGGAPAPREPRERQRGAQEHHHLAPGDPLGKLRGPLRELPLESGAVFRPVLDLRETSPVFPTHRWHPEQSVGGWTGRSRSNCAARARASRGGVHFMLVTSETGRR